MIANGKETQGEEGREEVNRQETQEEEVASRSHESERRLRRPRAGSRHGGRRGKESRRVANRAKRKGRKALLATAAPSARILFTSHPHSLHFEDQRGIGIRHYPARSEMTKLRPGNANLWPGGLARSTRRSAGVDRLLHTREGHSIVGFDAPGVSATAAVKNGAV